MTRLDVAELNAEDMNDYKRGAQRLADSLKVLDWFKAVMADKLLYCIHKGGPEEWRREKYSWLMSRANEELGELHLAIESRDPERIRKEAADVANYMMFIADKAENDNGFL